jgi:hypothetical protein
VVLWANHCKPHGLVATSMPIPLMTWLPRSSRLGLDFEDQPRNPVVLWRTTRDPTRRLRFLATTLCRLHIPDFILLFLPPCSPHLIPPTTESLKASLLVPPHLGGHIGIDLLRFIFTCTNGIKSQLAPTILGQELVHSSTLRCQSLITKERPHRSSDAHRSSVAYLD